MIEFLTKNQKNITMGLAITLLVICYFQQRELARLRKETFVVKEIKTDTKTVDSLLIKNNLK
jgi:hypothetical protein